MALWLLDTCCPYYDEFFSHHCACPVNFNVCVSETKYGKACFYIDGGDPYATQYITFSGLELDIWDEDANAGFEWKNRQDDITFTLQSGTEITYTKEWGVGDVDACDTASAFTGGIDYDYNRSECIKIDPSDSFATGIEADEDGTLVCEFPSGAWSEDAVTDYITGYDSGDPATPATCDPEETPIDFETEEDYEIRVRSDTRTTAYRDVPTVWYDPSVAATEGTSCITEWETFGTGYILDNTTLVKTTVKIEAVLTGLSPGFYYTGEIPVSTRPAVDGESYDESDWTNDTAIAISTFKATDVFALFGGGTLNVPDQDFIDQDYSIDPLDYPDTFPVDGGGNLIDPTAKVITPSYSLSIAEGYAHRAEEPVIKRVDPS